MSWDAEYQRNKQLWGERPSELAFFAVDYLRKIALRGEHLRVIDVGCGYGRDVFYLARSLGCPVAGIDNSPEAISMAKKACPSEQSGIVSFKCGDFSEAGPEQYDVVFVSNLYQVLRPEARAELRETVKRLSRPGGLVFLGTLSVSDPEQYGKGTPVSDEVDSFVVNGKYLHFCRREELERDFSFLRIKELREHKYDEPHANGPTHHHVCWLMAGELVGS